MSVIFAKEQIDLPREDCQAEKHKTPGHRIAGNQ